jgi:virginiamycin B lyase
MLNRPIACIAIATALTIPTTASAAPVEIEEWDIPWEASRPRDPFVAPDGRVWFNGQASHYIAVLDPSTGEVQRVDLPDEAGPHNLIVDEEGIIWYAGNLQGYIGRYDPADGEFQRFPMPEGSRDPHTLVFGPSDDGWGDIWFTLQRSNQLGRLDPATGSVTIREVDTDDARPYGIIADEEGVWVVLFRTNRLARWDTDGSYHEVVLPDPSTRPRRLEVVDGDVWYGDYANGQFGVYRPATDTHESWPLPGGSSAQPYGMAQDHLGRLWIAESGPSPIRLVGIDPSTAEAFSVTDVPSGAGSIRHMYYDLDRHELWFGTDANTVGRARIPD